MIKPTTKPLSKAKLGFLVFCIAFGLNTIAFLFSKKSFTVDEVKNVWLYELPATLSPLDAMATPNFGPHQGVIGTLFMPTLATGDDAVLEAGLAGPWVWNDKTGELKVTLRAGLLYGDGSPIRAQDWVDSIGWAQVQAESLKVSPEWAAFQSLQARAPDDQTLILKLQKTPAGFDFLRFAQQVLAHPLTGVFHPTNLTRLKAGERIIKNWISSGPYKVRKWNPKEITLVSRDSFPIQMPKEFFRTLRYQSAPVKNPSCDFMQADGTDVKTVGEKLKSTDKDLQEHSVVRTGDEVHVFWICRSWKQRDSFCSDVQTRANLSHALSGDVAAVEPESLKGKTVQYRIPVGSDAFRTEFRKKLEESMIAAGGRAKEVSYFFKNSEAADLELGFVVAPASPQFPKQAGELAARMMELSTRAGSGGAKERYVVGEVLKFPLIVLMKRIKGGEPFKKVFLEPDLEEKKLPL